MKARVRERFSKVSVCQAFDSISDLAYFVVDGPPMAPLGTYGSSPSLSLIPPLPTPPMLYHAF